MLKIDYTTSYGITINNARIKVKSYNYNEKENPDNDKLSFETKAYNKIGNNYYEIQGSAKQYTCTPDHTNNGKNMKKQCYDYLKSLPEYAGAVEE